VGPTTSPGNNEASETDTEAETPVDSFEPVPEADALLSQRCKLFYRREGAYVDRGLATLYVKQLEDSGKKQLLIRYV
jgi:nuclear pore complex protein Nup50